MRKVRILLVDPHEIVREGFGSLLRTQADMHVVGETASAQTALDLVESTKPDVVLLDISAPGFAGATWFKHLQGCSPHTKVLIFAMREDKELERELRATGIAGLLLKRTAFTELVYAIRQAVGNQDSPLPGAPLTSSPGCPAPRTDQPADPSGLTDSEKEMARLVGQGFSNQEIAERLALTKDQVAALKQSSMSKLKLRSRIDFVRYAQAQGWLENS